MKKILSITLFLLLFGCQSNPAKESNPNLGYEGQNGNNFGHESIDALLASLKSHKDARHRIEQGWTIINIENDSTKQLWSFTPEGHFAHPSAVKREVVERDGSISIEMEVSCNAEKSNCDKLVQQFVELNESISKGYQ